MDTPQRSRGGRPRSFDRDQAVETAMRLFWRHGYEGVSVGDLTDAIGIAAPSLYAAFGSKAGLFRQALARYEEAGGGFDLSLIGAAGSLEEAVRLVLEAGVRAVTDPAREPGCMISGGMIACHPDNQALARDVAGRRGALREAMSLALRRWTDERDAVALSWHLAAVLQGMSIQARDGAAAADLRMVVDEVVFGLRAAFKGC